jgi:DNA repair protein RadA/Sms
VLLVEVQALCVKVPEPPVRRRVAGLDPRRAEILLAALERWADLPLGKCDVFLSVAGGVAVEEPGADLATALAVASVLSGAGLPADTVAFGEIGLRGEVRPVPRARIRLAEAARLGYRRALAPPGAETAPGIETVPVADLAAAVRRVQSAPASESDSRMRR